MIEALDRLRWEAFCDWLAEGALSVEESHHIVTCTQTCLGLFKDLEKVLDDKDTKDEFVGTLKTLHRLMAQFLDVGRSSSIRFSSGIIMPSFLSYCWMVLQQREMAHDCFFPVSSVQTNSGLA